jgi:hypothetical protein
MNEVNRIGGVVEFTIDALRPPPRHSFACTFGAVYFVPPLLARFTNLWLEGNFADSS